MGRWSLAEGSQGWGWGEEHEEFTASLHFLLALSAPVCDWDVISGSSFHSFLTVMEMELSGSAEPGETLPYIAFGHSILSKQQKSN